VAQGEAPEGYVPPAPTHPNYGYMTPEEIAELVAQERERAEAAERVERTEVVFLPPTPAASTWAPPEPAPEPPLEPLEPPVGREVASEQPRPAEVVEGPVPPEAPTVWVPAEPAEPWVPAPVAEAPGREPEPEREPLLKPEPEPRPDDHVSVPVEQSMAEARPEVVEPEPTEKAPHAAGAAPGAAVDPHAAQASPEQQWGAEQWQQQPHLEWSQQGEYPKQSWVPQGQQIPTATQPAAESYQQWERQQAQADTTAYTWQGENGELYAWDGPNSEQYGWDGQAWILTNPGYAASPQQPQPEPQQQVNDRGELVYTWQGADGQMYVWDPRLEQWIAQGYQAR